MVGNTYKNQFVRKNLLAHDKKITWHKNLFFKHNNFFKKSFAGNTSDIKKDDWNTLMQCEKVEEKTGLAEKILVPILKQKAVLTHACWLP